MRRLLLLRRSWCDEELRLKTMSLHNLSDLLAHNLSNRGVNPLIIEMSVSRAEEEEGDGEEGGDAEGAKPDVVLTYLHPKP